jgi:hypothetical protein
MKGIFTLSMSALFYEDFDLGVFFVNDLSYWWLESAEIFRENILDTDIERSRLKSMESFAFLSLSSHYACILSGDITELLLFSASWVYYVVTRIFSKELKTNAKEIELPEGWPLRRCGTSTLVGTTQEKSRLGAGIPAQKNSCED